MTEIERAADTRDGFSRVEGRLTWHGCDLLEVASRFGTPCHVGASEAARMALERFVTPFRERGLAVDVRYSVKSNPVPRYLATLMRLRVGFEAGSLHELDLLRRIGASPGTVVISGLRDGVPLAGKAAEIGVEMITVTTRGQLESLMAISGGIDRVRPLPVAIGVCPDLRRARWDTTLSSSSPVSPIGFPAGSPELDDAMETLAREPAFDLRGLHMHIGSGIRSAAPFASALKVAEKVLRRAALMGYPLTVLDAGGGFGSAAAPVEGPLSVVKSLLFGPDKPSTSPSESFLLSGVARAVESSFERLQRDGLRPQKLLLEPGRLLSGPSQLLLLTVTDIVDRGKNGRFLLCDGGAMSLSPLLVLENHQVKALLDHGGERFVCRVLGNLPTALDRVAAAALLPKLVAGDRIAVLDTGAYTVSMNNTFRGPRPPIVWIEGEKARLARRRETEDELYLQDAEIRETSDGDGACP